MINVKKIIVLTIDRHKDRHERIRDILKGIDFEFYYGFDAPKEFSYYSFVSEIPDNFFEEKCIDKNYVSRWSIGQLGAYYSIREMIKYAHDMDFESVLIFEDDFKPLCKNFIVNVNQALLQLPSEWDLFLLGFEYDGFTYKLAYHRAFRPLLILVNFIKKSINLNYIKKLPKKFNTNIDFAGNSFGGHAFIISRNGIKKLLNNMELLREGGDVLVNKLITENSLNAFSIYPLLFKQLNKNINSTR